MLPGSKRSISKPSKRQILTLFLRVLGHIFFLTVRVILFLELFKRHGGLVLKNGGEAYHLWAGEQSKLKLWRAVRNTSPKGRQKGETRTQAFGNLKQGFSQTLCLLLALGFYSVKHSNAWNGRETGSLQLCTSVLGGLKKKMNVAMNSVHLQTNGLTLPPPSSPPPPQSTLCPLLWIKTCTHTCTHRESCPLIKGLVSPNPRSLQCRKCLSF